MVQTMLASRAKKHLQLEWSFALNQAYEMPTSNRHSKGWSKILRLPKFKATVEQPLPVFIPIRHSRYSEKKEFFTANILLHTLCDMRH